MLVILGIAVAVLALVAIPRVREGEKILTPDGETAVRDARRRAGAMAAQTRDRAGAARTRAGERAREHRARSAAARAARQSPPAEVDLEERARSGGQEPADAPPRVIDLRERPRPDLAARQRIARALEWGEPEPGPRHRR